VLHHAYANTAGLRAPAAMGLGARWSTRSSTAVTAGFDRGHRAPVTTNTRRLHRDSHRRCTRMCKRPNHLPPAFQVQSSLIKASTTNTSQVATPAPCGVICHLQPVVRAVGPRRMSGCGPGTRATCSAVLSGALEAYPPLGTTPGVLGGGGLVAGYRKSPAEDIDR
jgi:hypothetical protein